VVSTRQLALSLIISFVISFFTLVLGLGFAIQQVEQKDELNRISNMVGRQRTLVRSLQAAWLIHHHAASLAERMQARQTIDSLTTLLENTHFNLLNKTDTFSKVQLYHTPAIDEQLALITPLLLQYVKMVAINETPKQEILQAADVLVRQFSKLVDVQYSNLHRDHNRDVSNYLWTVLLIVGGMLIFQNLFLVRPTFKKLDEKIKDVSQAAEFIERQNRELVLLQDSLQEQNEELTTKQEELQILTETQRLQNEQLEAKQKLISEACRHIRKNIMYATQIQAAFRTDPQRLIESFPDCFVLEKAKDLLSGDFYWYTEQDKYKILAVSDCTGHGVSAALMTMVGVTTIYQIVKIEQITIPSIVLYKLHHRIIEILQGKGTVNRQINDGMDISLLVFDTEKQVLTFAGANSSICLVRNGQIERVVGAKLPIGSFQIKGKRTYPDIEIPLKPGDKIYAYSDGFQDQFGGPNNTKYYSRGFRELLLNTSHVPMTQQKILITNELRNWQGRQPQTDDILVVGVQSC
jgi:serine phosphatase RsbU (regulator of sigma subunit)